MRSTNECGIIKLNKSLFGDNNFSGLHYVLREAQITNIFVDEKYQDRVSGKSDW